MDGWSLSVFSTIPPRNGRGAPSKFTRQRRAITIYKRNCRRPTVCRSPRASPREYRRPARFLCFGNVLHRSTRREIFCARLGSATYPTKSRSLTRTGYVVRKSNVRPSVHATGGRQITLPRNAVADVPPPGIWYVCISISVFVVVSTRIFVDYFETRHVPVVRALHRRTVKYAHVIIVYRTA